MKGNRLILKLICVAAVKFALEYLSIWVVMIKMVKYMFIQNPVLFYLEQQTSDIASNLIII